MLSYEEHAIAARSYLDVSAASGRVHSVIADGSHRTEKPNARNFGPHRL